MKSSQITEYNHKEFKAILAIDFDRTICNSDYPALGEEIIGAGIAMRFLVEEGFGIVINTCRAGLELAAAIEWLHQHTIPYHYVNCNFPHIIEYYHQDCRKISADMYIDDKNVGGLPPWDELYLTITNKFYGKS